MTERLEKILISSSSSQWHQRIRDLHRKLFEATYFDASDERNKQLMNIIKAVRERKEQALQEFTQKFDGVSIPEWQLRVSREKLRAAHDSIDKELLASIRRSIGNVRKYQEKIFVGKKSVLSGSTGIKYTPIKRVGVCVPGASAPLPSTVVMTAVPARVAGGRGNCSGLAPAV